MIGSARRSFLDAWISTLLMIGVPVIVETLVYLSRQEIRPSGSPVSGIALVLFYLAMLLTAASALLALLVQRVRPRPEHIFPAAWFGLWLWQMGLRLLPYDNGFSPARIAVLLAGLALAVAAFILVSRARVSLLRSAIALPVFCGIAAFSLGHLFEFPIHSPVTTLILATGLFAVLFFLPPVIPGVAAAAVLLLQFQSRTDLPAFAPPSKLPPFKRVILIGVDGLSPEVVRKMAFHQQIPSFQKILAGGVSGRLNTLDIPFSPLVWNTIYTGARPENHGILAFTSTGVAGGAPFLSLWLDNWTNSDWMHRAVDVLRSTGATRIVSPTTAEFRRMPALWNMIEQNNAGSNVVGGWTTYPPEMIHGTFISDYAASAGAAMGTYYPMSKKIDELLAAQPQVPPGFDEIRKYLMKDSRMHSVSMELLRNATPDVRFHFAYYCAVDAFGHHYGTYMDLKSTPAKRKKELAAIREQVYKNIDSYLQDYLELVDNQTLLILISDHGYHFDKRQHNYPVDGAILMLGRNVRQQITIEDSIYNIAPTVLYALGMPPSADFQGQPIKQAFEGIITQPQARKYERGSRFFKAAGREELDEEKLRELEDLQYIDR